MQLTNKHNLPAPIVAAVRNDSYKKVGDISITGLIQPPQKRVLEKRYYSKLTEDVSDRIFSLLGQVTHGILERASTKNEVAERRMTVEVRGWQVSGQPDLYESIHVSGGMLSDYKLTSTAKIQMGDAKEWEQQLNAYAWLFSKHGIEVKKLQIIAIIRDWSKSRARREKDYPQAGVQVVDIPLWPLEKTAAWVEDRVQKHQAAESCLEKNLPSCTDEERWSRPGVWAVMKNGQKRAVRLFDAEDDARIFAAEKGLGYFSTYRPGEKIRCQDYCSVSAFCPTLKRELPEGVDPSMNWVSSTPGL